MKTIFLFFLLFLSSKAFAQEKLNITGDWVLPDFNKSDSLSMPFEIVKLEHFSGQDYVALVEGQGSRPSLYKVRKFEINGNIFFDAVWLSDELNANKTPYHYYWHLRHCSEDSIQICLIANFLINLSNENIFDSTGLISTIDTTKIDFKLIYYESPYPNFGYMKEGDNWKFAPKNKEKSVCTAQNPALVEYLIQKYWSQIKNRLFSQTHYRWRYFTWDKVNTLKSKDILSVTRLDRYLVNDIFETAAIDSLLKFKQSEKDPIKIISQLNNYHLVREPFVFFNDTPSFWIFVFKDGSRIKVKTNLRERELLDVTHNKLYYYEESKSWY